MTDVVSVTDEAAADDGLLETHAINNVMIAHDLSIKDSCPDLPGSELDLSDPGGVHQGAWPPQRVDDALPLWRQADVASSDGVEGRVDAMLEVLRR